MSPEAKSVKLACLASLVLGVVCLLVSVFSLATSRAGVMDCLLLLVAAIDAVLYGFKGARAANVPSEIAGFGKNVLWTTVYSAVVVVDLCAFAGTVDPLMVGAGVVCLALSLAMTVLSKSAAKKIELS